MKNGFFQQRGTIFSISIRIIYAKIYNDVRKQSFLENGIEIELLVLSNTVQVYTVKNDDKDIERICIFCKTHRAADKVNVLYESQKKYDELQERFNHLPEEFVGKQPIPYRKARKRGKQVGTIEFQTIKPQIGYQKVIISGKNGEEAEYVFPNITVLKPDTVYYIVEASS